MLLNGFGGIIVGGHFLDAECKVLLYVQDSHLTWPSANNTPTTTIHIARQMAGKQLLGLSGLHINGSN